MLTKTDFLHLTEKQNKLDADIRENRGISITEWLTYDRQHRIAFSTEAHEFINEYRTLGQNVVWKYWSVKPTDFTRLVDEAVDALHFACLILNKTALKDRVTIERVIDDFYPQYTMSYEAALKEPTLDILDHLATHSTNSGNSIALIMALLTMCGYSRDEVLGQYDIKNNVNYMRQTEGY